ncbi:DMT family transporter [Herbiconiux sp. YIM B11900]|uniref:DMT family transporter n=1 Tax=Herbiconiux sp. YIM B11900 TaxID=3404131 RepID=UPI003F8347A4
MLPVFAVLLAAIAFGTTGTAQAFGPTEAGAGSVGAARILIGGGLLGVVAIVLRLRSPTPAASRTGRASTRRLPSWLLVAVGALGVLAYQPAFFAGTSANGVAVGTVVALGSAPVLTGLLDWALHRRFPGRRWLIATVVATAGVTLISGLLGSGAEGGSGSISPPGILASLGAGASYAVYTLAAKALLQRGWGATPTMGTVFGVAALGSIPLLLAGDASWLTTPEGLAMALWLGVVTTALAYLLFGWGLARLPAATVSTLTLAEPLTATVLGTLVLGELLSGQAVAGLIVLAAGLVILALPARSRRAALAGA